MKRIILMMAVLAVSLAVVSCEKISHCLTGPYAPADASVSWTDYNSVEALVKYFDGHDSTLYQHNGETIKVSGYYMQDIDRWQWTCLASEPKKSAKYAVLLEFPTGGKIPQLAEGEMYDVTATIVAESVKDDVCQAFSLVLHPQKIEKR